MRRAFGVIATILGVVASLIAIIAAREAIWAWLYPVPLIVLLAVALAASWVYMWLEKRAPSEADQARLDRVLRTLPRETIRRLEAEDFEAPWRERNVYPFVYYVEELGGPEEHFRTRALEKHRQALYDGARAFIWAEAKKGFVHEPREGFRNTGASIGEVESDPAKLAIAEQRGAELRSAAAKVFAAHEALVVVAGERRYSLNALSSEPLVPSWEPGGNAETGVHQ